MKPRWDELIESRLHCIGQYFSACLQYWEVGPSSAVCTESPPLVWSGHPHKTASTGHGPAAAEYRPPHWPDGPLHTGIKSFFAGKLSHVMPSPCGECPEGRRTRVTQWLESRRWRKKVIIFHKKTSGEIQQTQKRYTPSFLHTEKELPVIQPALVVRVFVNLAQISVIVKIFYYYLLFTIILLLELLECAYLSPHSHSFGLFAVNVSFNAGLSLWYEEGVPKSQGAKCHSNCTERCNSFHLLDRKTHHWTVVIILVALKMYLIKSKSQSWCKLNKC